MRNKALETQPYAISTIASIKKMPIVESSVSDMG